MTRVIIYKVALGLRGGGITFLQSLIKALESSGYEVLFLAEPCNSDILAKELKNSDAVLCYGLPKIDMALKIMSILKIHRKPILFIFGGTILVRKPDRPLYILQNFKVLSKLLFLARRSRTFKIHFATHSRDNYLLLERFIKVSTFYMPPAVDSQVFKPMTKNTVFTLVCNAAPASWVKGTDFLLKIIPRVICYLKESKIIILTGGMGLTYFRNALKAYERKFPDRIEVIDRWLSSNEVASILGKSHLLVFPSRFEGFGILVLEAQSCGVPVIAFDIPGAPRDVVVDGLTGRRVRPYNLKDFTSAIVSYYELWKQDPSRYAKIQEECRKRAKIYDIKRIGRYWSEIVKLLLETHSQTYD